MSDHRRERARLSLEGLSVGDAFGESFFLPPTLVGQLFQARATPPPPWAWTDDTAMAVSILEELDERGTIDCDSLARRFAERYRHEPRRGYGGTAHEILQAIGTGVPWREAASKAFDGTGSQGNGAAMRAAPLGAWFADDLDRVADEARRSAQVTHMNAEGQAGAIAVAVGAAMAVRHSGRPSGEAGPLLLAAAHARTPSGATRDGIDLALSLTMTTSPEEAAAQLGSGVRVLSWDTVPFSLWCAARHLDDYSEALWTTVRGLGDRDTTCAIVGGIVALSAGAAAIPRSWRDARERLPI